MVKLRVGQSYVVVKAFTDFDRRVHPLGERWVFVRDAFLPYDSGLTWVVQPAQGGEWTIRMWWDERGQIAVIEHVEEYLRLQA